MFVFQSLQIYYKLENSYVFFRKNSNLECDFMLEKSGLGLQSPRLSWCYAFFLLCLYEYFG